MSRTDEELIRDALDHIDVLKRHLNRGDLDDETVADAVSLRLAAAIEAIAEASPQLRERSFGDEWRIIWSTAIASSMDTHTSTWTSSGTPSSTIFRTSSDDSEPRSSRHAASINARRARCPWRESNPQPFP